MIATMPDTSTITLTFDGNEFIPYGAFMFSALLNECRTKHRGSWAIYRGDVMLVCSRDYDQRRATIGKRSRN